MSIHRCRGPLVLTPVGWQTSEARPGLVKYRRFATGEEFNLDAFRSKIKSIHQGGSDARDAVAEIFSCVGKREQGMGGHRPPSRRQQSHVGSKDLRQSKYINESTSITAWPAKRACKREQTQTLRLVDFGWPTQCQRAAVPERPSRLGLLQCYACATFCAWPADPGENLFLGFTFAHLQ